MARFGSDSPRRRVLATRLRRIHALAIGTGHLGFVIFGSIPPPRPILVRVFSGSDDLRR